MSTCSILNGLDVDEHECVIPYLRVHKPFFSCYSLSSGLSGVQVEEIVGNAIDKKMLSTINKILIDNLSISSFCY